MNTEKNKKRKKTATAIIVVIAGIFIACSFKISFELKNSNETLATFILDLLNNDGVYTGKNAINKYNGRYMPSFIPDGYEVTQVSISDDVNDLCSIQYNTSDGNFIIIYSESYPTGDISIDCGEDGELATELVINGFKATRFEDKDGLGIVMYNTNIVITLTCSDKEFDIIKFAESIEKR